MTWKFKSIQKLILISLCCFVAVSIGCKSKSQLFNLVDSSVTNINFRNDLPEKKGFNILYYLYYYEGGGVAIGDINNDGLPDIYFTANTKGNNKLYLNKGNLNFEDITTTAGVAGISDWCSGVTIADVNGDGWLDIYVCSVNEKFGLNGHNQLFINNHNNTFTDLSQQYGLDLKCYSAQAAFFDYDHDGDLDCYVLNESDRPNQNIVDTSNRRKYDSHSGDRLFRNDLNTSAKKFTDVTASAGIYQSNLGYGLGLAIGDVNNDGWDDIYIGNDFHENDYYYVNQGNGTFNEEGAKHFNHYSRFSMGNDIADYNNDGQLDIITVDMLPSDEKILKTYGSDDRPDIYNFKIINNGFQHQYSKNCLQRNNGDGTSFSETSLISGISATDWSWCPLFADFDHDGNKDLFVTSGIVKRTTDLDYVKFISNAFLQKQLNNSSDLDDTALSKMPDGISHSYIYKGSGKLTLTDKSKDWGFEEHKGYFNGAAYADLDNDGDLDLVINAINAKAQIYKNNSVRSNFITVSFKGVQDNQFGIGAKVYVFTKHKKQYQQLMLTRGFQSSGEAKLNFGLDTFKVADSLIIVWPGGKYQVMTNIKSATAVTANINNASGNFYSQNYFKTPEDILLQDSTKSVAGIKQHKINFDDFSTQYLIPHAQSTRGPKMAIADVNNDGLDDIYVCGEFLHPGSLLIQQADHSFKSWDTTLFKSDSLCIDVDAVFFDVNGDGFKDLYVASGGYTYDDGIPLLADKLYINDGTGHFKKDTTALPANLTNKSCVTIADIDHDGDQDIFVGTLANAHAYGIPQTSHLLLNNGKGHFAVANQSIINLNNIGIVTSAVFTDINKDGWNDLVIAGEWMGITVFINNHGKLTSSVVPASTGWWQTLYADDVNNDGNVDIVAGNWGLNNKFSSGKNGPVKLYVSDFDGNGQVDQLMSYTLDGEEYPFLAKDEVERQLPLLKKHYLKYAEYAGVPMKDVFYGWIDTTKPLVAERLASTVCFGDGKGGFTLKALPEDLQLAPIFSFKKINSSSASNQYLAGGNFYDVIPYEGRYDAQPLALFSVDKTGTIKYIPQANLSSLQAQVRDIKIIKNSAGADELVVAVNHGPLIFYKQNFD